MFIVILKLFLISLITMGGAVGLKLIDKFLIKEKLNKYAKYAIYGILFGVFAILGTVFGVSTSEGAVINVRDVPPIVGGLIFGWPVGVIAGLIGGVYRMVAVAWGGAGEFTMYACGIATILAGVFTALYKGLLLKNKPVKMSAAFYLSILVEDMHMLLVFLTRWNFPERAYNVTELCALPMILVTTITSMLTIVAVQIINKEPFFRYAKPPKLSSYLRGVLAASLIVSFLVVSTTSYILIKNDTRDRTKNTLNMAAQDIENNVDTNIRYKLIDSITQASEGFDKGVSTAKTPEEIMAELLVDTKFTEINFVSTENKIVYSTVPKFVGYDMGSGEQSDEFSHLLNNDADTYIQSFQPISYDKETYMRYCGKVVSPNPYNIAYIEAGYDEDSYNELVDDFVSRSALFTHINEKGFLAVTDFEGNTVSILVGKGIIDKIDVEKYDDGKIHEVTFPDEDGNEIDYTILCKYVEGYYVVAFADTDEVELDLNISFSALTFSQVTLYLMLYFAIMLILQNKVVSKIGRISKGLNQICDGDLNVHVNEHQSYEFDMLSNDINKTVDTLQEHARQEAEKIEKELLFAKQIQLSALPCSFPAYPNISQFDLFASMDTAKEVGGDFYDFYLVDADHIAIQIADVSGKGVPAAMFMMKAKTVIKSLVGSGMPIDQAYIEANNKLCEGNDAQMFVTAWLGVIDIRTGHVEFINAGHNPPLIKHANGEFEFLQSKVGFVLAGLDNFKYVKQEMYIEPGAKIFLYTDGVTEATNKALELYSDPRLKENLNANKDLDPTALIKAIKATVDEFADGAEQADDITMLAFQYNGDMNAKTIEVDALSPNVSQVSEFVEAFLEEKEAPFEFVMKINVVIDEIFSNIARYGFPDGSPTKVRVTASVNDDNQFVLIFVDCGIPYNPLAKEDPDVTAKAEDRPIGGLGIYIVKKMMDEMVYERLNNRNILTLKKNL